MDKWKSRLHTSIYFDEFTRTFLRIVSFSPIYMMFRFLIGFTQNRINLNRITNDWHTILSKWNYHYYHYLIIGMIIIENISTIFRSIEMKFLQTWRTTVFFSHHVHTNYEKNQRNINEVVKFFQRYFILTSTEQFHFLSWRVIFEKLIKSKYSKRSESIIIDKWRLQHVLIEGNNRKKEHESNKN